MRQRLSGLLLLLGFGGLAVAAPFQNGSFEIGPAPNQGCAAVDVPVGNAVGAGWTVSAGNVDWVGTCNWISSDGSHSLDLVGSGSVGGVQQTFDTVPGATYRVTFDLAGNPSTLFTPSNKPVSAIVNGAEYAYAFETTGKTVANMGWVTHQFSFTAIGASTTLQFVSNLANAYPPGHVLTASDSHAGAALDNVRVTLLYPPGTTAWTGSAGVVTNPGQGGNPFPPPGTGGTPIGSSPTVLSDGTTAPAVFTYATVNSFCCHTGDWTFQTTAASAGPVTLDWAYSGYHGTCSAIATLTAFVKRGGATIHSSPLYSASDATCNGSPPSGGFDRAGQVTLPALAVGDTYGFTMTASNYDFNGGVSGRLEISAGIPPAPVLLRAIEDSSGNSARLIGRVGFVPTGAVVQAYTATTCTNGVAGGAIAVGTPAAPNAGYVEVTSSGITSGQFVALGLTLGGAAISPLSGCLPSLADNDFWTNALLAGPDDAAATNASVVDYIDAPGKTRWYKFRVAPGQRIGISVTNPPADYDVAVFKDIRAAFVAQLAPSDSAGLTRLSAEFAPSTFSPSTFSPSTFSPSTFSPSTFSPSTFSPSTFSPSTFSPSTFSPSTFSPSTFSPSTFSPSTFSPSTFSPSTFSPSTFSPSTFSPSTFSPDEVLTAFSSAQTRSIIGVSATPGTATETVVVDSWNNNGYFYARVTGRGDAHSTALPFTISVTKGTTTCSGVTDTTVNARSPAAGTGVKTVILTDTSSFTGYLQEEIDAMTAWLATLAASTGGVVVDVANDTRVKALKAQAESAGNVACPFAMNLVAEEIKGIVDSYRANNPLQFVVIAGGDDVVPFFRYPDESMIGPEADYVPPVTGTSDASLRGNFVLSQDAYGAKTRISLRSSDLPVPGLAVGRLVKTPLEIAGMIEAALPHLTTVTVAGGVGAVKPMSSLVTGYDFLSDVSDKVVLELQAGTNAPAEQLIAPNNISPQDPAAWRASDLGAKLFAKRHDLVFLAGHFSANSALAADFATSLITSDVVASKTDFTNSIVFSAGCHSGYNIVDRDALPTTLTLDWTQAFAKKKATLIAGTGYQYGDTDFIEYSERLYLEFARQLRAGTGAVAVGEALVKAKIDYLAATPDMRGLHPKALLEATLYGLPMLGVDMPAGRGGGSGGSGAPAITPTPVTSGPASVLGLRTADLPLSPYANMVTKQLTGDTVNIPGPLATWLEGPNGVVSNPSEPALPLTVVNVTSTDGSVLRGVGFRGGAYTDSTIVPLTGAPAYDIRGVHTAFAAPNFFPNRPWTPNYFGALAGTGGTSLLLTPAQHRGADVVNGVQRSTLRKFNSLNLRLYYSSNLGNAALSDAPSIVHVNARSGPGGSAIFTAQVTGDPAAAIHQVWVTYTDGGGAWSALDLSQCFGAPLPPACGATSDSQIWKGTLNAAPSTFHYVVQAVSGLGLVTFDDNRGSYYAFNSGSGSTTAMVAAAQPTTLALSAPASAYYGDTVGVTATLTSGGQPVAGALVTVNIGGVGNSGVTNASGSVTVSAPVASAPGLGVPISASYAGTDTQWLPASAAASFTVSQSPTSLVPLSTGVGVRLTAGNAQQPLATQSVSFRFNHATTPELSRTIVLTTDSAGNATVPTAGLAPGTYSVSASFLPAALAGKPAYYANATLALSQPFTMNAQVIAFSGQTPTTPVTYAPPGTFAVAATVTAPNSGRPVTITSTTPQVCTVNGTSAANQVNYTATIVSSNADCVLVADIAGTGNYAPAQAIATIPIVKAAQTITSFSAPASVTYAPPGTFGVAATVSGPNAGQAVTITSTTPEVCTVAGTPAVNQASYTATIVAGGNCVLDADVDGNANYAAGHATRTIAIAKAAQVIAFQLPVLAKCPTQCTYGDGSFDVTASGGASGNPVTFSTSTPTVCTVSATAGTTTVSVGNAGTCSIAADQAGSATYSDAATVARSFTVNKAGQTIANFPPTTPTSFTYGDPPFVVKPASTSSAGFPVSLSAAGDCELSSTNPSETPLATLSRGGGSCAITASAPGDSNYAAVAPVWSFNILKTPQSITFANPGNKPLGTAPFALVASATSGLPVTFSVPLTPDVCTLLGDGRTLRLLSTGVCKVTASQVPGSASNFAAATDVTQSLNVYLTGLVGLSGATIGSNNGLVDSFDSTPGAGGYEATKGAQIHVLGNGTLDIRGATVGGHVQSATSNVVLATQSLVSGNVTAGTTVSNAGTIGGTMAANQPLPTIVAPAIAACSPYSTNPGAWISGSYTYNAAKGDLTVKGNDTATLAAGTYCLHSITLSGGATLKVSGPVRIRLTGTFTASGNSVANPTPIPSNLQIEASYTGKDGVTLSGGASGHFVVYAPGTGVTLSGNAELFGAVVGKTVTMTGNPALHYDVRLLGVWGALFGL